MRIARKLIVLIVFATALAKAQTSQEQASASGGQTPQTVAERLGYPATSRLLVIHADDFGMLHSVNKATIDALNNKWITSASILVPCPWFPEAARFARDTHFDTHMFAVSTKPPLGVEYVKLGRAYGIPLLLDHHELQMGVPPAAVLIDRILFLEPGVTADQWLNAYENILRQVPPGTYELIVHLAYADDEMRAATYDQPNWGAQWRQNDLDTVKNAEFQKFIKDQGFILVSWRELAKAMPRDWKSSAN